MNSYEEAVGEAVMEAERAGQRRLVRADRQRDGCACVWFEID